MTEIHLICFYHILLNQCRSRSSIGQVNYRELCLQGVYAEMVGPTLPDLKDRVNANYEEIARVLVSKSVGYCFGAILGGFFAYKYVYDYLL